MKQFYHLTFFTLFMLCTCAVQAQKRPLDHADFDTWNRINGQKISNDGEYVLYHVVPGKGDATLKIKTHAGDELASIPRGIGASFTWDSKYVIFKIKPQLDSVNALRRIKTKKDKLPKDSLGIYSLSTKTLTKIPRVKSFKVPEKWSGFITYQIEEKLPEPKDTTKTDTVKVVKPKKAKKVSDENGYHLITRSLSTGQQDTLKYVLEYALAEEGAKLLYHTSGEDSITMPGVYYNDLQAQNIKALCRAKGKYKQLALDKSGNQASFLSDLDTTKALIRNFQLRYWTTGGDSARVKAASGTPGLSSGWVVNENGRLNFSDNGQRLFFGTSPAPLVQDTTLLPEEIIQVEIWNYQNGRLHTQQNIELEQDRKKSYLSILDTQSGNITQIGSLDIPLVTATNKGDADVALGISNLKYQKYISWEGFPRRQDVYAIDLKTGAKTLAIEDLKGSANISPNGDYLFWYDAADTSWYTYSMVNKKAVNVSKAIGTNMSNELNDMPNPPSAYGVAGWTKDDQRILVYDRYDIWKVDPQGAVAPANLTNGRNTKTRYRYLDLDREEQAIDPKFVLLSMFNEVTRDEGYASLKNLKGLKELLKESYSFNTPMKAHDADELVFSKQSNQLFPNLITSDLSFKKQSTISDANPQQKDYLWSTVDVYKWTSLNGEDLEGLLYKPENFDPKKKYPMIVYFYERNSHRLNAHWGAVPIRSIVNPSFYASRGYLIFIPDIVYRTGYPGESCYDAVMPGVTSLIEEGFVDKDNIGVQGHSWGGYQVSYLVTKTNMFKAAEAGAVVSNMISAYGGIRWWTGLSRMFQYEHSQSRLGGTLWEYPVRFIENSPIFFADKIETPLLLMHNDADGHVPWYQGIEFFVALRRLGKPAWMLNYNGEPHWPTKWENIRDFNIRMQQYFDHYLKGADMPVWMSKEGIPAIEKGINPGYELMKE